MTEEEIKQEAQTTLLGLGLEQEDLDEMNAAECIVVLRGIIAEQVANSQRLSPSMVLLSNADAIAVVDALTDRIVDKKGLLQKAMLGEDIHDQVAEIKACVESLITGEKIEARTVENATKQMQRISRKNRSEE